MSTFLIFSCFLNFTQLTFFLPDIIINQAGGAVSGESALKSSAASAGNVNSSSGGLEGTATISMSESVDSLESIKSNEDDDSVVVKNGGAGQVKGGAGAQQGASPSTTSNGGSQKGGNAITGGRKVFVLSGRRRKKSKTYLIGNNAFDISRDRCMAKLKSNVLGTMFTAIR